MTGLFQSVSSVLPVMLAALTVSQETATLKIDVARHLTVARDSSHFAAADVKNQIFVWRTRDFGIKRHFQHDKRVVGLGFSRDGKSVIVVSREYGGEPSN